MCIRDSSEIALREAESVASLSGATYLDHAIAATAAAGSHAALGHPLEAEAVLSKALEESLEVGDVIAVALLQQSYAHVLGLPHPSGDGQNDALGIGWVTVVEALPTLDPVG